ncbi:ArgS-related anticodon-binding protein NrtL [Streptomyces sp. NPDC047973]|uniref:ArgS-related anticodon-binding protein NrtL n=1 Tax=Streptomyces sp. NPDC047973 TaxID=3155383 RepID=UPI0034339856
MTPADLSRTVLHAVRRAVDEDVLRAPVPASVRVERTRPGGSGDYACAVALQLAGPSGIPARGVAEILRERVAGAPGIGRVEVTGPGFLNFTLESSAGEEARAALVRDVLARGTGFGLGTGCAGEVRRLHHRREVRAAVWAAAVKRLLVAQGALVRTSCEEVPDPDWERLGVTVDAHGRRPVPLEETRPVPAAATAGELLERLGADAALWGLLRPAAHDHAPLDDGLLVQGEPNPLFLVRYAHARSRALVREGLRLGVTPRYESDVDAPALHEVLAAHPDALAAAARHQAPDRVARHLETVAAAFFDFHDATPPLPVGHEKPSAAHRSRLALAEAAGTVLAGGLSVLGISAPEHL